MSNFRIIPKIEVKQFNLVKGYKLEGLRVLGSPLLFIQEYERFLADEILVEDVMASILDSLVEQKLIKDIVKNTSVALTAGGGIKNIRDVDKIFSAGAERVILCSAAIKKSNLIRKIYEKYGSQSVAVKLEIYSKNDEIEYFTFCNGREIFKCNTYEWIKNLIDLGVGEIYVNFIDDDGTGKSVNAKLFEILRHKIDVPIIYSGGISSLKDIKLIENIGGDGVAIASALHYNLLPNIFDYKVKNKFFSRKNLNEDIGNYEWILNGYGEDRTSMVPILSLKEIKKNILTGRNQ
jgi:cyclase